MPANVVRTQSFALIMTEFGDDFDSASEQAFCIFRRNVHALMSSRRVSENALSLAVGRSRGWLSALIQRRALPNVLDCRRMADHLNCRIDDFFAEPSDPRPRTAQEMLRHQVRTLQTRRGYRRPQIHDLMTWFITNRGVLTDHEAFQDYVELFDPPDLDANMISPCWVGRQSLCSIELGLASPEDLRHVLTLSDENVRREVVRSHVRVLESGRPDTSTRQLEFRFSAGLKVTVDYIRVLLPVREPVGGGPMVLNYYSPMRRIEVSTREVLNFEEGEIDRPILFGPG